MNIPHLLITSLAITCATVSVTGKPTVEPEAFGTMPGGQGVTEYTLTNDNGMVAKVIDYGAIITELWVHDRDGNLADVVLGYEQLEDYLAASPYFGAVVGRYGNRIGAGTFNLEGETYELSINDGVNHLHGGVIGFDKVLWSSKAVHSENSAGVELNYTSPDGAQGYPGNLNATVTIELNNKNQLVIRYKATSDAPTVVNLTSHSYFNLRGHGIGSIVNHELTLNADYFTPVDSGLIPTGEIIGVAGTPMDFTSPRPIGSRINADYEQLLFGLGYDHNWVLDKSEGDLSLAARLYDPESGREMLIRTTEPGIQFYSGNFLDGSLNGKKGRTYHFRYGLCLETQHFPDSPNKGHFPSTRLNPGELYESVTIHEFSTQ